MSEPQAESEVPTHVGAVPDRPGVTVVTNDNMEAYVDEKLGVAPAEDAGDDPEAKAASELKALETKQAEEKAAAAQPKEGDTDGSKVFFKGKWKDKSDFGYRLHIKEQEVEKAAQAKIAAKDAEAKQAREEAAKAAKEAAELRAKYEPPKSDELGPKPQPGQFQDVEEYSKALEDWAGEKAIKDAAAKDAQAKAEASRQATLKRWQESEVTIKAEIPDFDEAINASPVRVSEELKQAIFESEYGHQIRYHLAKNPQVADEWAKLTVPAMLKAVGRLEGELSGKVVKIKQEPKAQLAEISSAPEPITPLRGENAPAPSLRGSDEVPKNMTYETWKDLYKKGKIK